MAMHDNLTELGMSPPFWAKRFSKNDVVIGSRASIGRNIQGFPFPHRMSAEQLIACCDILSPSIADLGLDEVRAKNVYEDCMLYERGLSLGRNPKSPHDGKPIFMDGAEQTLVMVNELNHLWITTANIGPRIDLSVNNLVEIEEKIASRYDFVKSDEIGYLTAWPEHHGSGVRASIIIHIPAIIVNAAAFFAEYMSESELSFCGPFGVNSLGDNPPLGGSILQVYHQSSNMDEALDGVRKLSDFAKYVTEFELEHRNNLSRESKGIIERMWGMVVTNCQKIPETEAISSLSLGLLGAWSGLVDKFEIPLIQELIYRCLDSHVMVSHQEDESKHDNDVSRIRANFIRTILKGGIY